MIATFAALLCAHALADFVLQPDRMAAAKAARRAGAMVAHLGIVAVTALLSVLPAAPQTGQVALPLALLVLAHGAIDLAKTHAPQNLTAFLLDQAAHLASLAALSTVFPDLWQNSLWAATGPMGSAVLVLVAGGVLTVRAGGFAVGLLMRRFPEPPKDGLADAGRIIGALERGVIFLLVLTGQAEGVGFLIAAKSVLRFGTVGQDRAISEYIIIGTLASFGWGLGAAYATLALLNATGATVALGIPLPTP